MLTMTFGEKFCRLHVGDSVGESSKNQLIENL